MTSRLRATERRLGIRPDVWDPDENSPSQLVWHHRVYVGMGALFVVYRLADARAVIDHYGGEREPHRVEVSMPDRDGRVLGVYRLRRRRWVRIERGGWDADHRVTGRVIKQPTAGRGRTPRPRGGSSVGPGAATPGPRPACVTTCQSRARRARNRS